MITDEQRAAWQALADAATDGPWEADERTGNVSTRRGRVADDATEDEAAFIAAARTAVPALLAALRETEAERDEEADSNRWLRSNVFTMENERDALARRIEAVRALHHPWGDTLTGKYICDACDHPLPCPTIRALDGEDR